MPWCPRCDESFPEGPSCPRCSARLVQRDEDASAEIETLRAIPAVRALHVSRRQRRALERMSGPRPPSMRLLALSIVALVFVSGFLLGRFAGIVPNEPTVRALAPARPLQFRTDPVDGSAAYALWSNDSLATIAIHDLYSGDVEPLARFSPPPSSGQIRTQLVAFGRSVALVASDGDHSYVAFAPAGGPVHGWVPGVEAAWTSEREVYVRGADGGMTKYSIDGDRFATSQATPAGRLFQTTAGAFVRVPGALQSVKPRSATLAIQPGTEVFAVSPSGDRALVDQHGPALWDGHRYTHVHIDGYDVLGASFERSGERVAVTLRREGVLTVAVVDRQGNASLKPLGASDRGCPAVAAWDAAGRWLYVAPGDGLMYALEASGGRSERVETRGTGCGLAWLAI